MGADRRIPLGRSLLDSSPSLTSSPVGASDWPAVIWQVSVIDPRQSLRVRDADGVSETEAVVKVVVRRGVMRWDA